MKKQAIKELIRKEDVEVIRYIQTQPVIDKIKAEIEMLEDHPDNKMNSKERLYIRGHIRAFKKVLEWLS